MMKSEYRRVNIAEGLIRTQGLKSTVVKTKETQTQLAVSILSTLVSIFMYFYISFIMDYRQHRMHFGAYGQVENAC